MCGLSMLHCLVCKTQDKYLFFACSNFLEQPGNFGGQTLKPTKHFYCANLKWPLNPANRYGTTKWICEECIEKTRQYYDLRSGAKNTMGRLPSSRPVLNREFRHFTEAYNSLSDNLKATFKSFYSTNSPIPEDFTSPEATKEEKTENRARFWSLRSSQAAYRSMTLWMPCCRVCNLATVTADDDCAVADIEFQPNEIMWKWIDCLAHQAEVLVQTQIHTGFMSTVCDDCVEKESNLRHHLSQFLDRFSHDRGIIWAVYNWLLTRGSHDVPEFCHATQSLGFPATDPPSRQRMMDAMAESWMRITGGMAWGDTVDLSPPISCPIPLFPHDDPLVSLSQWEDRAKHVQAVTMGSMKHISMMNGIESGTHAGSSFHNVVSKADLLDAVRPLVDEYKNDAGAKKAALRKQVNISDLELDRSLEIASKILARIINTEAGAGLAMEFVPVKVGISSRRRLLGNNAPTRTREQRQNVNVRSLITVKGAFIDDATGKAVRKTSTDPRANAIPLNTDDDPEMSNGIPSGSSTRANRQAGRSSQASHASFASGAGAGNSHAANDEDVDMEDAEENGPSPVLYASQVAFEECDKGCLHISGHRGTHAGNMICFGELDSDPTEEDTET